MEKALVLLSGGQDSVTCLALALSEQKHVEAVCFDYGQRHQIELEQAKKITEMAGISLTILDARFIGRLSTNALTDNQMVITEGEEGLPNTFVPGRNLFFLSMAAAFAYQKGITTLYTGVCQTDFSGYPDCRDEFIKSAQQTINLAMETHIEIKTPLMFLTKAETVLLMKKLGKLEWYAYSHTCYEGKRPACGVCPACKLRLKGFEEAGISDPISYEI